MYTALANIQLFTFGCKHRWRKVVNCNKLQYNNIYFSTPSHLGAKVGVIPNNKHSIESKIFLPLVLFRSSSFYLSLRL